MLIAHKACLLWSRLDEEGGRPDCLVLLFSSANRDTIDANSSYNIDQNINVSDFFTLAPLVLTP